MVAHVLLLSVALAQAPSPQARAAFERAERALNLNQLEDAEAAYRDAIAASPQYAEALNGLGSVLFKKGQRDEALRQFRAAVEADPRFPLAYFNLGFASRRTGDFAGAAQAYETYTKLRPDDPDGFYGLGESYRELGQREKAIIAYEKYVGMEKRPSEQKWVDRAKDNITRLKGELAQGTPAAPAQPPPAQSAPPAPAQQPLLAEIRQEPAPGPGTAAAAPSPLARTKVAEGDAHMQAKNYREASFAYQAAVNAAPENIEANFKLGNAYAVLGYFEQAIERWTQVAKATGDANIRKSAEDNITRAKARIGEVGGASPQAAGAQPGSGPIAPATRAQARQAYEAGVSAINSRNYEGALKSLTLAISFEPNLGVAYVARGSAFIGLRRFNEAIQDYQYAQRLDPNLASPLYGMAESYRALGRNTDARRYYEQYAASKAADVRPELQEQARQKAALLR